MWWVLYTLFIESVPRYRRICLTIPLAPHSNLTAYLLNPVGGVENFTAFAPSARSLTDCHTVNYSQLNSYQEDSQICGKNRRWLLPAIATQLTGS